MPQRGVRDHYGEAARFSAAKYFRFFPDQRLTYTTDRRISGPSKHKESAMKNRIFSFDSPKAIKANKFGYLNAIHYMAPHDVAGAGNLCPKASEGCKALCLGLWSGQAGMVKSNTDEGAQGNSVRQSRTDKARRFMSDRAGYMRDIVRSIELAQAKAKKARRKLAVRLNGSTDIAWEGIACERNGHRYFNVMSAFPELQFVDYTKIASRFNRPLPPNYDLTFSRSESNESECLDVLAKGRNVAIVFGDKDQPVTWNGFRVIDGDQHDLRHLDPKGVVVGLTPKGAKAKRDRSGFVLRTAA
jgi:hypothetical protein